MFFIGKSEFPLVPFIFTFELDSFMARRYPFLSLLVLISSIIGDFLVPMRNCIYTQLGDESMVNHRGTRSERTGNKRSVPQKSRNPTQYIVRVGGIDILSGSQGVDRLERLPLGGGCHWNGVDACRIHR